MRTEGNQGKRRLSTWLVRVWFGGVALTALVLAGLLVYDWFRGEGISHLGLAYLLELSAVAFIGVALALLPLLVLAVVINRKAKA